jgi:hypothetical protein
MAAAAQAAGPPTRVLAFDIAYDPAVGEPLYNARCAAGSPAIAAASR